MAGGLAVLLTMGTLNSSAAQSRGGGGLEGTWDNQITVTDCSGHVIRSFPSLVAFNAGGTVTEASAGTAPALQTGGKGVWSHTTDSSYAFRFRHFNFNAQNVFTGWNIIEAEASLDATANAYTSSATIEVYDPNGNLLASLCADAAGTRFQL